MSAKYVLRLDDICPGMNWTVWDELEHNLNELRIKPLVAVVPDNRDPALEVGPRNPDFWSRVRQWEANGWTIAVHGFQHTYVTTDAGVIGINQRSEFAGLSYDEQLYKLRCSMEIFQRERLNPGVWVAPAHSFDHGTLQALREVGIRIVSDGFALSPYSDAQGMVWVPQQLWRFRQFPAGVWTVCTHVNAWSPAAMSKFVQDVRRFRHRIISFAEAVSMGRPRKQTPLTSLGGKAYLGLLLLRRALLSMGSAGS